MSSLGVLSQKTKMAKPLGADGLGLTMSSNVPKYFSYEAQHWNQYPPDVQQQINAQANLIESQRTAQYKTYIQEGACDATRPGRLAGGLRELLVNIGGDVSKMGKDEAAFGPLECKEWWRIWDRGVEMFDAGSASHGMLDTICKGVTVKLPSCPKPVAAVAPAPKPIAPVSTGPIVPAKPKYSAANIAMVGGALAAVTVLGYAIAKKKGWIKPKAA